MVTTLFFEVPKQSQLKQANEGGGLTKAQLDNMDYFERFITKIVEDKFSISPYGHGNGVHEAGKGENSLEDGIDLQELLSRVDLRRRWLYRGSFTTPPCTEGVLWNIIDDVQYMSERTLQLYNISRADSEKGDLRCRLCAGNQRNIQPLNGRTLFYVNAKEGQDPAKWNGGFGKGVCSD